MSSCCRAGVQFLMSGFRGVAVEQALRWSCFIYVLYYMDWTCVSYWQGMNCSGAHRECYSMQNLEADRSELYVNARN